MKMLERSMFIPPVLMILLLTIPMQTPVGATEIIFDDFDDMDYDGWETYGTVFNRTENIYYPANSANFSASDKALKVTGPAGDWSRQLYSVAYINHSVNYGTWSFDLYVVDTPGHEIVIHLMADSYYPPSYSNNISKPSMNFSYCFIILTYGSWANYDRPLIEFWSFSNGIHQVIDRYDIGPAGSTWSDRWTHFDITRNPAGHFDIYLNRTLCMSVQPPVHDIPLGYFHFTGQTGHAIDNLLIYDVPLPLPPETTETPTPTPTPTTTTTESGMTPFMFTISIIELVVIVLLLVLYLKQRKSI